VKADAPAAPPGRRGQAGRREPSRVRSSRRRVGVQRRSATGRSLGFVLGLLAFVVGASASPARAAGPPQGMAPGLERRLAAGPLPADGLPVIVALRAWDLPGPGPERRVAVAARQQAVLDAVGVPAPEVGRRFESLAGLALRASEATIRALARHPEVEAVYLDGTVRATLAQGTELVGAAQAESVGFTGEGVAVAILDTGVDGAHPDLADAIVAERCFCVGCCPGGGSTQSGAGSAQDENGHGTSVAGIVTAPAGTAPDAGIAAIKVLATASSGRFSDIDAGLDWVLTNGPDLGIRVVNLSLGDGGEHDDAGAFPCSGTVTAAGIAALADAGISVFASSGNEAHDAGISFPACVPEAVSVGGVYDASLGRVSWCADGACNEILCTDSATEADDFVCHTSSGSLLDLLAPDWRTVTSALGGGTVPFAGTSASSPYAAGQAALLYQADPGLAPEEVRDLLVAHGPQVTNPANGLAFPRADVAGALASLIGGADADGDGVPEDGDGSGVAGDAPCADGETALCDDNCPATPNPAQGDADGDGIGDLCDAPCSDGLDNDGDGLVDFPDDPGCFDGELGVEDPACDDGVDNDGDGLIDYPDDPQCTAAFVAKEALTGCGLGAELALLLAALWVPWRRARGARR